MAKQEQEREAQRQYFGVWFHFGCFVPLLQEKSKYRSTPFSFGYFFVKKDCWLGLFFLTEWRKAVSVIFLAIICWGNLIRHARGSYRASLPLGEMA